MSLAYVRETYGVPVKRGQRVIHEGRDHGTVTQGDGAHVRVRFDGDTHSYRCHPLALDYGDGISPEAREAEHNRRIDVWNLRLNGWITADEYVERMASRLTCTGSIGVLDGDGCTGPSADAVQVVARATD